MSKSIQNELLYQMPNDIISSCLSRILHLTLKNRIFVAMKGKALVIYFASGR